MSEHATHPNSTERPGQGPLAGVRVVEFGQLIAAPGASNALAALGATVVKIEPIGGESAHHMGPYGAAIGRTYNRGKQSVCLNLRSAEGRALAKRLVATSDVLVQNMRPGGMDKLGLGAEELRAEFPGLVYASVSGYPAGTASADRVGLDIAAQAESGMMSLTGTADREPQRVGFPVVDAATADLLAQGILAALFRKERTGEGAHVQLSLLEVAIHLQGASWAEYAGTGVLPSRSGNGQATVAPAADVFTLQGGDIVLSAYTVEHWRRLCQSIGRPELESDLRFATNSDRVANRAAMRSELQATLGPTDRTATLAMLRSNGIVAAPINTLADVLATPAVHEADMFADTQDGRGVSTPLPRMPYRFDGRAFDSANSPKAGGHTHEALTGIGLTDADIDQLVADGTVEVAR
ncbi:CaiB/BaiF CoA transferase family protein [Nocardioides alcanivorans]|uniref:CaiB/BaiF CoA transferase family protein n=1 Tax=Nocardioides alcanivorans TaxID=2897352 RepID=UPI001F1708E6|nr:CoA transferase [Nocardioides alcanivorans]